MPHANRGSVCALVNYQWCRDFCFIGAAISKTTSGMIMKYSLGPDHAENTTIFVRWSLWRDCDCVTMNNCSHGTGGALQVMVVSGGFDCL
jgi:hypothetical protein